MQSVRTNPPKDGSTITRVRMSAVRCAYAALLTASSSWSGGTDRCRSSRWNSSWLATRESAFGTKSSVLRSRRGSHSAISRQISSEKRPLLAGSTGARSWVGSDSDSGCEYQKGRRDNVKMAAHLLDGDGAVMQQRLCFGVVWLSDQRCLEVCARDTSTTRIGAASC